MFATIATTYLFFVLPAQLVYHFLWGKDRFLFAREVPVEVNGDVYMVKTRCRRMSDFAVEVYTEHIGMTLPVPEMGTWYTVNGERL